MTSRRSSTALSSISSSVLPSLLVKVASHSSWWASLCTRYGGSRKATPRVQQIVKQYREEAGITQPVHPHLFRHQMITYLTTKGLSDSQIQLISRHESKKSLEVYQHLSLKNVEQAYQKAVKSIEV